VTRSSTTPPFHLLCRLSRPPRVRAKLSCGCSGVGFRVFCLEGCPLFLRFYLYIIYPISINISIHFRRLSTLQHGHWSYCFFSLLSHLYSNPNLRTCYRPPPPTLASTTFSLMLEEQQVVVATVKRREDDAAAMAHAITTATQGGKSGSPRRHDCCTQGPR
jgi:hypothetical protein